MRKGQTVMLEKAKKNHMKADTIEFLSREDLTLQELDCIYKYILKYRKKYSEDVLVSEANRCLNLLCPIRSENDASDYKWMLALLLNIYWWHDICQTDDLVGSSKKKSIVKAWQFFKNKWADNQQISTYALTSTYASMLKLGLSAWHVGQILRFKISSIRCVSFEWLFGDNPSILDDFRYNKQESLLYYIMQNCKELEDKCWNLEALYDWENHSFVFSKEEYIKFVSDVGYIKAEEVRQYTLKQNPLLQKIVEFVKSMYDDEQSFTPFSTYTVCEMEDKELEERCLTALDFINHRFTVDAKAVSFSIGMSSSLFTNIKIQRYGHVLFHNKKWYMADSAKSVSEFVITPDGRFMRKYKRKSSQGGRLIPMTMKDFYYLSKETGKCGEFVRLLSDYLSEKNLFFKDVYLDMQQTGPIIPLTIDEVMSYHNRAECLRSKYKTAKDLPVKWNKQNINLSYLIIKSLPYVDGDKGRRILLQQKDPSLITKDILYYKRNAKYYAFLEEVARHILLDSVRKQRKNELSQIRKQYSDELAQNVQTAILPDEYEQFLNEKEADKLELINYANVISDYVSMCRQTKSKVKIDIHSVEQLQNLHDDRTFNRINYRKATKEVKVPKNSVFLSLREILPPEFEWITTRKRLILETELQHHCVWSYASMITEDKSAIYSFTDTNSEHCTDGVAKRYTIEFKVDNSGKYYVEQVQGKRDRVNAGQMREYVQELLNKYQNTAEKAS